MRANNTMKRRSVFKSSGSGLSQEREYEESDIGLPVFESPPITPANIRSDQSSLRYSESHDSGLLSLGALSKEITHEQAVKEFGDSVTTYAHEIIGEALLPIDIAHSIKRVKLELSSEPGMPTIYDTCGAHRTSNRTRLGNIRLEDIFTLPESNASDEAVGCNLSPTAKNRYVNIHGNRVLVTGQAGIGKTTLSIEVVKRILGNKILPGNDYVFYIKCRAINFNENLNLLDFILKYCSSDDLDFKLEEKQYIAHVIERNKKVAFIFDGMDQASTNDLSCSITPKVTVRDAAPVSVIVRNLMSGQLLPKAKVLVTSRPRQAFLFSPEYRPGAIVQIMGLETESQKQLGKQICGNDFLPVYQILHQDPNLEGMCYVTVICLILYAVVHEGYSKRMPNAPKVHTITQVMIYLLDKYMRSVHMRNIPLEQLAKIARLARIGYVDRKLVFDREDITKADITSEAFQAFMVTYLDENSKLKYRIFEGDHRCSFSHEIWREFFTAIDLTFFVSENEFERYCSCLTEDSRWEVVAKIMFGLTNQHNSKEILSKFPSTMRPKAKNVSISRRKRLYTQAKWNISRDNCDTISLLQVCHWVKEADDPILGQIIAQRLPETFCISGTQEEPINIFNNDVQSIIRVLQSATESMETNPVRRIHCDFGEFQGDSFRLFMIGISKLKMPVHEIRLRECGFGTPGATHISRLFYSVERIHVAYCNLTAAELTILEDYYFNLTQPPPEFWIFNQNSPARDFGYELTQRQRRMN